MIRRALAAAFLLVAPTAMAQPPSAGVPTPTHALMFAALKPYVMGNPA